MANAKRGDGGSNCSGSKININDKLKVIIDFCVDRFKVN